MNPRHTLLLFGVVAALGAFLWFYEIRGAEERSRAEEASHRVFPEVESQDVSAFSLRTPEGDTVRLERREGGWEMTEPVRFEADALAADAIASAVAELSSEAVFREPEPPAAYGLTGEATVRATAGGRELVLRVGDKTPVGGNTYVAGEADAPVYAVPTFRLNALAKSVTDLRDKRIVAFERAALRDVRVSWPGGGVHLVRGGEDEPWRLVEPLEGAADEETVDALLSTLEFLRAEGFVDGPPDEAAAGLADPALRVELRTAPEAEPVRVVVGSTTDGEVRRVRGRAEDVLYEIPAPRIDDFPRKVVAYRFKYLARFPVADARRFEIAFEEAGERNVVTGRFEDGSWSTEPPMAAGKASRLVAALSSLEAEDVAAESMGEAERAKLGLAPPRVRFRVFGAGGDDAEPLADLTLGLAEPGRGIAARRGEGETVWWLPFDRAADLPLNDQAFENRFRSAEKPAASATGGEGSAEPGSPPAAEAPGPSGP